MQEQIHSWPPKKPHEVSVNIATKKFLEHLQLLMRERLKTVASMIGPTDEKRASEFIDLLTCDQKKPGNPEVKLEVEFMRNDDGSMRVFPSVSMRTLLISEIQSLFFGDVNEIQTVDHVVVADALNTLPSDSDLRVLAQSLASYTTPAIESEFSPDAFDEGARQCYESMMNRTVEPPDLDTPHEEISDETDADE